MLISFKTLIEELEEDRELKPLLFSFLCAQDEDIERILHNRAIEFERLSKARTYLVCGQYELETKSITELTVYGYISLALKVLTIPDSVSNRIRKKLDVFSAKIHGEQIRAFPCYLIGQLARNSNVSRELLAGEILINFACDIISTSVEAVGGRYMMIECKQSERLIKFYENNRFTEIARIPDNDQPMVQMIRKI